MDIPAADRIAWFRDLHETIAATPTSWAVKSSLCWIPSPPS